MKSWKVFDLEQALLRKTKTCVTNIVLILNAKHSIVPAPRKKLTLFQPKLGNSPNWPKAYFMPHNVILKKNPQKNSGEGDKGKVKEGGDGSLLKYSTCLETCWGTSLLPAGEAEVFLCNTFLPTFLHLLHCLYLHSRVLSLLFFLLMLTSPACNGSEKWVRDCTRA